MRRKRTPRTTGKFFVGDRSFPVMGAAISYAQGLASHWPQEERSFYVRDAFNVCLYRVDLGADGIVRTWEVNAEA